MSGPEARFSGRRMLALGGDAAAGIAEAFEGAAIQSATLSEEAVRPRAGRAPVVTPKALVESRLFRDAHVVVATIGSRQAQALFQALAHADLSREVARPIVVMLADGDLSARAPADVLVFETGQGRARYEAMAADAGFDATNAVISGAPDHAPMIDQCAALLMGQDMRGSALPLRRLPAPASDGERIAPSSRLDAAWRRVRAWTGSN